MEEAGKLFSSTRERPVLATLLIRTFLRKDMRNSQGSSLHLISTSRFSKEYVKRSQQGVFSERIQVNTLDSPRPLARPQEGKTGKDFSKMSNVESGWRK
jgi:hypothetical protein